MSTAHAKSDAWQTISTDSPELNFKDSVRRHKRSVRERIVLSRSQLPIRSTKWPDFQQLHQ